MRQIRARIQAKRGVDYTEQQIQELANVKLERFLDPKGVRSDLVEQFKRARDRKLEPFQPRAVPASTRTMLYGSHRGIIRLIRKLLNPILKLFFNPNTLIQVLHKQTEINTLYETAVPFPSREEPAARRSRRPVLRARPQPGARADARRHRESQSQDAARVAVEPDGLRRAARTGARRRRPVSAGHRARARAAAAATASRTTGQLRRRRRHRLHRQPAQVQPPQPGTRAPTNRPANRTPLDAGAADAAAAAAAAGARRARTWQQEARRRSCVAGGLGHAATRRSHGRRRLGRRAESDFEIGRPATTGTIPAKSRTPQRSEARYRRAALRRRHQRRRRAARALRGRASVAPRRCRSADDLRARLRHLARRLSRRASKPSTASPCAGFASISERDAHVFGRWSDHVFNHQHSYLDELKWLDAEGPKSTLAAAAFAIGARQTTTTSFSSATGTITSYHGVARGAVARDSRADRRARRSHRPGDLAAHLSRRARAHVQQPRRAAADSGGLEQPRCPGVVVGIGSEIPSGRRPSGSGRSTGSRAICALRRAHRSEQGLQRAVFVLPERAQALPKGLQLVLIGKEILPIPEHPRIQHLGFSTTRTSSMRWPRPTCC